MVHAFRQVDQSATGLLSIKHPFRHLIHQQVGVSSRTSFSGRPVVGLSTLAYSLRNLASRLPFHVRRVSLAGHPLTGGHYLGACLAACRPVGNGSACYHPPFRTYGSSADCQVFGQPLRNIRRLPAQVGFPSRTTLSGRPVVGLSGLGVSLAELSQSVTVPVRRVSLAGHLPTSGRYLDLILAETVPVGNGSAFHDQPFRARRSSADLTSSVHALQNEPCAIRLASSWIAISGCPFVGLCVLGIPLAR